jgi:hypothetical protein
VQVGFGMALVGIIGGLLAILGRKSAARSGQRGEHVSEERLRFDERVFLIVGLLMIVLGCSGLVSAMR